MHPDRRRFLVLPYNVTRSVVQTISTHEKSRLQRRKVIRRNVLKFTAFSLGYAAVTGCQLPEFRFSEQYTALELQKLGQEIADWTLRDGSKMVDLFPDARKASDLLIGKIDPRVFNPFVNPPITFGSDTTENADFTFHVRSDVNDSRFAGIHSPSLKKAPFTWISKEKSSATINISKEIQQSTIRWSIGIKEILQLYDEEEYCQLYLSLLESIGGKAELVNPKNIATTKQETTIVLAYAAQAFEKSDEPVKFLDSLIDIGSHIRVGGIMFANWYLDQLNRGQVVPKTGAVNQGLYYMGLLQNRGLIKQEGNAFKWVSGHSPTIDSPEFLTLFKEASGRNLPVFP